MMIGAVYAKAGLALALLLFGITLGACGQQMPVPMEPSTATVVAQSAETVTSTASVDTPTAAAAEQEAPPADASSAIMDMVGRSVTLPGQVERIAGAGPGALRIIVYLEAQDMVAGVEETESRWGPEGRPYIMAHPALANHPSIGSGGPGNLPDMEALVQVNPDVLFMTDVDARTADTVQSKTGIPVVVLNYGDSPFSEEFLASVELAGRLLGKETRASEVIAFIQQSTLELDSRTSSIPEAQQVSAYVGGIGSRGAHGIESTQSQYPLLALVHGRNVSDDEKPGNRMIDREKLLEWEPEVIFLDEGGLELVMQDYAKVPDFYHTLSAFQAGKVYGLLPYNYYTTNVETALVDAYFIGKALYPDLFEDMDPLVKADEIYNFFVGKPLYAEMAKAFGGLGVLDLATGQVHYEY